MPINIENLNTNSQWISLFDLYMIYKSPLTTVNEDYYEFILEDQGNWYGSVTLNHRKLEKVYLKGDEKNIYFWRGKITTTDCYAHNTYIDIWNDFYTSEKHSYK